MGDLKLIFVQTMLLACFANPGLARPEVDKGDLFFIAELAKTSNNQVVLTVGNENSVLTHLPLLLTSAHLAEGGAFDQHLIVVRCSAYCPAAAPTDLIWVARTWLRTPCCQRNAVHGFCASAFPAVVSGWLPAGNLQPEDLAPVHQAAQVVCAGQGQHWPAPHPQHQQGPV